MHEVPEVDREPGRPVHRRYAEGRVHGPPLLPQELAAHREKLGAEVLAGGGVEAPCT
jgi:hypothetical protein